MAIVAAIGAFLIMMGFWFAGAPAWVMGEVNVGAIAAAVIAYLTFKIGRSRR
jgi:hypothetical protein